MTGLGFVCIVAINVLPANRVDFGLSFHKFSNFTPPPHPHSSEAFFSKTVPWPVRKKVLRWTKSMYRSERITVWPAGISRNLSGLLF